MRKRYRKKNRRTSTMAHWGRYARFVFGGARAFGKTISLLGEVEKAAEEGRVVWGIDPARRPGDDKTVAVMISHPSDGSLTITEIYEAELFKNPFQEEPHEKVDDLNGSGLGPGPGRLRR